MSSVATAFPFPTSSAPNTSSAVPMPEHHPASLAKCRAPSFSRPKMFVQLEPTANRTNRPHTHAPGMGGSMGGALQHGAKIEVSQNNNGIATERPNNAAPSKPTDLSTQVAARQAPCLEDVPCLALVAEPCSKNSPSSGSCSGPQQRPASGNTLLPPVRACGMAEVMPFLFLGTWEDANDARILRERGITHILSVAKECREASFPEGTTVCLIPLSDSTAQALLPHLHRAVEFIEQARLAGGKVLVHCRAGISRSAAVVIAYIMYTEDIPFQRAFDRVKAVRPNVSPNLGFLLALEELEKHMRETRANAGEKRSL